MRSRLALVVLAAALTWPGAGHAQDMTGEIRHAVEHSTLDQPGTNPFHLKAALAPSFDRDRASGRTGTVEIWWAAPGTWRREVRSPDFHQVEIVTNGQVWQKNDGDFFPEWLRETAVALVRPVPNLDQLLAFAKSGEVRHLFGSTHISWVQMGSDGTVSKGIGAGIDLGPDGMKFASGVGYSAGLSDFAGFHGRSIARKVTSGGDGPEVTAKVTVLEDLKNPPPELFNPGAAPSDPLLETYVVDELAERKNLMPPPDAAAWPPLAQGPLQGVMLAKVVIDRDGKVRTMGSLLSDNPGLNVAAGERISRMRFQPYLVNGSPAQVVTTITLPFRTVRPAGTESFDSARTFFDRARKLNFPSAGASAPYLLRADFTSSRGSDTPRMGNYTDTWVSSTEWRREITLGDSRIVRCLDGKQFYQIQEGPDVGLLRLALWELEPIPATDVWYEADWRIQRDTVNGVPAVRVARGYEPNGVLAPAAEAYWFDASGTLIKAYGMLVEAEFHSFSDFGKVKLARKIIPPQAASGGLRITVTSVGPAGTVDPALFVLAGHEAPRQFTPGVR